MPKASGWYYIRIEKGAQEQYNIAMTARVVVVDDDQSVARLIATSLEDEGYEVSVGYDGHKGMQLLTQHKPHLAILDINMPMFNGLKMLELMVKDPQLNRIPVLFLSGAASEHVYPLIEGNPRVFFIKKPLDIVELLSFVPKILEKFPPAL